jgi:hypothetical protein
MSSLQDIWNSYKDLLKKSYVSRSFDAWCNLWANECRFVSLLSGSSGEIEIDFKDDGSVYETKDKPDTFLVIPNFVATVIRSGYRYENRLVCQITVDGQRKIGS